MMMLACHAWSQEAVPGNAAHSAPAGEESPQEAIGQSRIAGVNALFTAVFKADAARARQLISEGVNPNDAIPLPLDAAVADLFRPTALNYFLTRAKGLTPLMVAATLGHKEMAAILLQAGADKNARIQRHGTTALWLAGYMGHTELTKLLLGVEPGSKTDRMRIEIDLETQTARLLVDGTAGKPMPISSGRRGHATPKGEFVVTDKHRHWRSTIYKVPMPFYLRLSCRAFGLHAGSLPGHPASHGCIRLGKNDARNLFELVQPGVVVVIK